jgi:chaperonin GroES
MSKKCTWHRFGVVEIETLNLLIMSISFKPLADRVLIEPAAAEEKTASGIIIPDTAKEKPLHGVVKAVGSGKKDEPITLKVGDNVMYGQYSGTEIKIDGNKYLIMKEADVYGVIG